jgi:hypothetical protein
MKIEMRAHFWPNTPTLREIKILIDGEEIRSSFLNKHGIFDLSQQLKHLARELLKLSDEGME